MMKPLFSCVTIAVFSVCMVNAKAGETLQQAWASALATDRSLLVSRDNTASAVSMMEAAKAARLPRLAVEAGYTVLDKTPGMQAELLGQSIQLPIAQKSSASYKAVATLPLYEGGRIEHGIQAAAAGLAASQTEETRVAQDLKLRVAEAFVGVLRTAKGLEVAQSHLVSLETHAADVKNLLAQGMVPKNDHLAAQVVLADARQKFLQAGHALESARAGFNWLLGRPLDQLVALDDPSGETAAVSGTADSLSALTELTKRALAQRSELAGMVFQMQALRKQSAIVRAEARPQLALSGGYGHQQNRYQVQQSQWFVGLGVSWNVFDGGVINHRADALDSKLLALTAQHDELVSQIGLQVHQAMLQVQEMRERHQVTRAALGQAEENLRVVKDRYTHGLDTQATVLAAETLRINAKSQQATSQLEILLAGLRLKRAVGEL